MLLRDLAKETYRQDNNLRLKNTLDNKRFDTKFESIWFPIKGKSHKRMPIKGLETELKI